MYNKVALFFQNKLLKPLINFLKEGISPEKLALSVSLGVVIGIIPILGATTILCGIVALIFRINMPAIQLVNYFVYPLQLLLFIPFLKFGAIFFQAEGLIFSINVIKDLIQQDFWAAVNLFWKANLGGLILWFALSPVVGFLIYFSVLPLFRKFVPDQIKK